DLRGEAGETWGRGQIFGIVPLPDDRVYWFGTLTTPPDTTFPYEYETIRNQFAGWHDAVQACIDATPADAVMRHDIYDLAKPLASSWIRRAGWSERRAVTHECPCDLR